MVDQALRARIPKFTGRQVVIGLLIASLTFIILSELIGSATDGGDRGGVTQRRGSSLNTTASGTRAYADLLQRYSITVRRLVGLVGEPPLDPSVTAVMLDPFEITTQTAATLRSFVSEGGHLVIGGGKVDLSHLIDSPPQYVGEQQEHWIIADSAFNGAHSIRTAGEGYWSRPGATTVVVGSQNRALITRETIGRGTIDYLADATLLNNDLIATDDNAAFGVGLADNGDRPVVFIEGRTPGVPAQGIAVLPTNWKLASLILAVAAILYAWHRSVRFGPPDALERNLAPARSEYIDAIAKLLAATKDPDSARVILANAAHQLLHAHSLTETDVETLAAMHRCDADDFRALFAMEPFANDPVRAARAFAAIQSTAALLPTSERVRT